MPGLHLATSVTLLSSIPAPTAMPHSKRAQYIPVPDKEYMPRNDSLDGSLGLFLVMCGLILLFVLAVTVFFWRVHVHRRSRRAITTQDVEEVRNEVSIPALLYNPDSNASHTSVKLPPSLRVRSPIKNKLKFFRIKSAHGDVADADNVPASVTENRRSTISKNPPMLSLPSIVVSDCSPAIPIDTSPADSTTTTSHSRSPSASSLCSVSSTASADSLRVPGAHNSQTTILRTDTSAKRVSSTGRKVAFKSINRPKGLVRSSSRGGKENVVPRSSKGGIYDMQQLDHKG